MKSAFFLSTSVVASHVAPLFITSATHSPRATLFMQQSPLQQDALSIMFGSPILRVGLAEALPDGTLEALEEAVMTSWDAHCAEQESLPQMGQRRHTDLENRRLHASSNAELNEEFYYFQKGRYGVTGHYSAPKPDSWLASEAASELLEAVSATVAGYLERIAHHRGLDIGRPWSAEDWQCSPDSLHVWASVHQGGSTHPRHVHADAVCSAVLYVRTPPGAGSICFFDPRGSIPPFEREVRHEPSRGDLLLFPPWLSHAVATAAQDDDDGPRISISFNLVEATLEGEDRSAWGSATAGLDVVAIEDGLCFGEEAEDKVDEQADEDADDEELQSTARALVAEMAGEGRSYAELRRLLGFVTEESRALMTQLGELG